MIKTVIFDIGNVLTHFNWQDYIKSLGFSEEVCKRVGLATVESRYWAEFDRGVMDEEELVDGFVSMDPELEDEIRLTVKDVSGMLLKADYAIPWIEDLKGRGYKVLYLSNFSDKSFRECQAALDFLPHMDGGVFSYRVKLIKPDQAIYRYILNEYDLIPAETVFIDDTMPNVETARSMGMNAIHFKTYEQAKKDLERML